MFERRQFQYHTQYPGHGAVAPQHLAIKNQVLQFAAFDGHDDGAVRSVQGCQNPLGSRLQGQAVFHRG